MDHHWLFVLEYWLATPKHYIRCCLSCQVSALVCQTVPIYAVYWFSTVKASSEYKLSSYLFCIICVHHCFIAYNYFIALSLSISYLYLPLLLGVLHCMDWERIIQMFDPRQAWWKSKLLLDGGKLISLIAFPFTICLLLGFWRGN